MFAKLFDVTRAIEGHSGHTPAPLSVHRDAMLASQHCIKLVPGSHHFQFIANNLILKKPMKHI